MNTIKRILPLILCVLLLVSCATLPADEVELHTADVTPQATSAEETAPALTTPAPIEPAAPATSPPAESPVSPAPEASSEAPVVSAVPLPEVAAEAPSVAPPAQDPAPATVPIGLTCTLSISCSTLLDHWDELDAGIQSLVPADGWLLPATDLEFTEGETVFDVLSRACYEQGIHLEFVNTPLYNASYIEGIGNLYEFDYGPLSGWLYSVNHVFPGYGYSQYALTDGDIIAVVYTCDLGDDVGGGGFA